MSEWLQMFTPRKNRFFDAFERQSVNISEAARALRKMLDGDKNCESFGQEIRRLEADGDLITRSTLEQIRKTLIAPFFRSDISALINAMDDVIDHINQLSKKASIYEISRFDAEMQAIGNLIVQAAELTQEAMPLLRSARKNAERLNDYEKQVSALGEHSEVIREQGLKKLFLEHRESDPIGFLAQSEIYSSLRKVLASFAKIAQCATDLVIDQT
ncbi:hypothetical protein LMG27198_48480 [Methylocystis echinoides]|uniref:Pit accessory protein n=2 Tax=Methylocystis echinoides TaxID=29468 RepID=A0A9W6LUT2_9HYPH|nr:hypothetical protein LMG27198_48480 [Methylocystis echinoides]